MRKRNEKFRCKLLGAGFDITVFTLRYADFIGNKLLGIIVVLPQGTNTSIHGISTYFPIDKKRIGVQQNLSIDF